MSLVRRRAHAGRLLIPDAHIAGRVAGWAADVAVAPGQRSAGSTSFWVAGSRRRQRARIPTRRWEDSRVSVGRRKRGTVVDSVVVSPAKTSDTPLPDPRVPADDPLSMAQGRNPNHHVRTGNGTGEVISVGVTAFDGVAQSVLLTLVTDHDPELRARVRRRPPDILEPTPRSIHLVVGGCDRRCNTRTFASVALPGGLAIQPSTG